MTEEIKKWNRSLGTSKRAQGIITPKRTQIDCSANARLMGRIMTAKFLARAWDHLSERVKLKINYMQMSRSEKTEAIVMGYKPYE